MDTNTINLAGRQDIINQLQSLDSEVLKLKSERRQKRPIVIEFSGSPKSGKTSCINSLELFLKRNGFKVEIIQERASVCPVGDKQSPMFNIWTACTSLSGMIGVLERKDINCDVLILDRGIFDAMCWFHWLSEKNIMEASHRTIVENFFLLDTLVRRIDIVFSFSADPAISIEREYAKLLTDKLGTIMNKKVLAEYLAAMKATIKDKSCYFHKIFEIDTSEKDQDAVGKEVTDKTLETLRELLVEKIGYFDATPALIEKLNYSAEMDYSDAKPLFPVLQFGMRDEIECVKNFIQPIPIAVICNKERNKVLIIKKNANSASADSPEKDKFLFYVGGHSRYEDFTEVSGDDFLSICRYTLNREVKEEIGISLAFNHVMPFVVYTPDNEKSKQHMGICFLIEMDIENLKLRLDPQELVVNKGKSKSGSFIDTDKINTLNGKFESWSAQILKKCFNFDLSSDNNQISLFDE